MADEATTNGVANGVTTDPLVRDYSMGIKDGDWVLLHFADGRQIFVQAINQALSQARGKASLLRIGKKNYPTYSLIGLEYGGVLELGKNLLTPLPEDDQELLPSIELEDDGEDNKPKVAGSEQPSADNRNLIDNNHSQTLNETDIMKLQEAGTSGSEIIQSLMQNSATFSGKTSFSKAKWITRKQLKWTPRCRLVECTSRTICSALYTKDHRKLMNMREDSLGQILSYANISAGKQVLVYEQAMGVLTGSLAHRMGGYGKILSVYNGQQATFMDMLDRFNLSFAEQQSLKWLHAEDVFVHAIGDHPEEEDVDAQERDRLKWPCYLQEHTRAYLERDLLNQPDKEKELDEFMQKRCNRFARKLTRTSPIEARNMLLAKQSDSLILATRYDPTATLLKMLPHLAPSCPFVVFHEFMQPLAETFLELQKNNLAINLRLCDAWMREYQVLPGRTHPNMHMSQNGGFLLTGIKLDPVLGVDEMDESLRKEIREEMGGRRGKKKKRPVTENGGDDDGKKKAKIEK